MCGRRNDGRPLMRLPMAPARAGSFSASLGPLEMFRPLSRALEHRPRLDCLLRNAVRQDEGLIGDDQFLDLRGAPLPAGLRGHFEKLSMVDPPPEEKGKRGRSYLAS